MGDGYEWDEDKARQNIVRHRISFEIARLAFDDPIAIERVDDRFRYNEARFIVIGMVAGRLLVVAYTLRNGMVRIISARGAEPNEKRRYHEDNALF